MQVKEGVCKLVNWKAPGSVGAHCYWIKMFVIAGENRISTANFN